MTRRYLPESVSGVKYIIPLGCGIAGAVPGEAGGMTSKSIDIASEAIERRRGYWRGASADVDVMFEYFDPSAVSADDIAEACSRRKFIDLAVEHCRRDERAAISPIGESAIYVIGPPDGGASKIGLSKNPPERLRHLQGSNWHKLTIHALFWVMDNRSTALERLAHIVGERSGAKIHLEWFDLHPALAADIVAACVQKLECRVADSCLWLRYRYRLEDAARKFTPRNPPRPQGVR